MYLLNHLVNTKFVFLLFAFCPLTFLLIFFCSLPFEFLHFYHKLHKLTQIFFAFCPLLFVFLLFAFLPQIKQINTDFFALCLLKFCLLPFYSTFPPTSFVNCFSLMLFLATVYEPNTNEIRTKPLLFSI